MEVFRLCPNDSFFRQRRRGLRGRNEEGLVELALDEGLELGGDVGELGECGEGLLRGRLAAHGPAARRGGRRRGLARSRGRAWVTCSGDWRLAVGRGRRRSEPWGVLGWLPGL